MTWNHDWCTEWRLAFVMRSLDDDEQMAYADHRPHCPDCTVAVAALSDDVALLSLGVAPLEPGPALHPTGLASRIVASTPSFRPSIHEASSLATAQSIAVRDDLGLLEVLHDASGQQWAARLRGVPHSAALARFRLAWVDGAFDVHR
jgi:hypothetical protein